MKKILIFILTIIILIFAYNEYKDYKRFHPKNANYLANENIDLNYHDQSVIYDYNEAISTLNGFVLMQWSANEIDVKHPEDDDAQTRHTVSEYSKKLAKVKFYEAKLIQSKELKSQGLSNADIESMESKGFSLKDHANHIRSEKFKKMMVKSLPKANLIYQEKSAFVYEMQKLLVKKGFDIPVDGIYKSITSEALKGFEERNQLFPDGKIDIITLDKLLE